MNRKSTADELELTDFCTIQFVRLGCLCTTSKTAHSQNSTGRPSIPLAGQGLLLYHSVSSRRLHNKLTTHAHSNRKKIASHYRRLRHYMWMYVIILAVDGRWLWKCSLHTSSKALHWNRKWRPARMSHAISSSSSPGGWRAAAASGQSAVVTYTPADLSDLQTVNWATVLASSRCCTDVRSYHWHQSDVKWTSRLAVYVSRRLIDVNLTYLCYLGINDCCQIASPAIFEILRSKRIGVSSLTFQGHVTSSITWPFDSS